MLVLAGAFVPVTVTFTVCCPYGRVPVLKTGTSYRGALAYWSIVVTTRPSTSTVP